MSNSNPSSNENDRISGIFIPLHLDNDADSIQYLEWFRYFLVRKWSIASVTGLVAVLSMAVALFSTPIFRAEVLLAPNLEKSDSTSLSGLADQFGGLSAFAGLNAGGDSVVQEAIATLQSRDFTLRFIRSQNLMPILFENKWDVASSSWENTDLNEVPTEWDAYEIFDLDVRSIVEKDNGLVVVQIEWSEPKIAAQWANTLVADLNELMRSRAIDEATTNMSYLQQELQNTSIVELRTVISHLIEAQVNSAMLARTRDEYSFRVIDPAVAPDDDQFIRPNRPFIIIFGLLAGFSLGLLYSLATRRAISVSV